jgi:hypothetical protein
MIAAQFTVDPPMLDQVFQSFAHPHGPGPEQLNLISGRSGTSTVRRALHLGAGTIDDCSVGLAELLQKWLDTPGDVFWHPAISQLKACLNTPDRHLPPRCLVEIGFVAQLDGAAGRWSFRFAGPTLLWIDRWLVRDVVSGAVQGEGAEIHASMRSSDGSSRILTLMRDRQTGAWRRSPSAESPFELPAVDFAPHHRMLLVPGEMVDVELLPQYPGAKFKDAAGLGGFASCLKQSADLISSHAPEYVGWVAEVVKFIAPVAAPADLIGSSSSPRFLGMISISDDSRPLSVAAFLVHEASHQYFYAATSLGRIDEGSQERLYYSRFARRQRPLERILAAFHALGNMALFYEQCLANGVRCELRLAYVSTHMRELDETLHNADTLTSLGRSIWSPLSQKTRHLDMKADETISDAVLSEADRVMARLKEKSA